jgi:hypothetical protein
MDTTVIGLQKNIRSVTAINILRYFIFVSMCVLICLGPSAFSQLANPSPTPKAAGEIDNKPITITLDATKHGRTFAGIGGNFRLQNPTSDPPVIKYNLENLRVAWGRVAMPWNVWQTDENSNPIEAAKAGQINQNVRESMEMAQKLAQRRIPFIISIWAPPTWALQAGGRGGRDGGGSLNQEKWDSISKSIGSYILYMKNTYGAEPELFSFNESEMGINVRQTPAEHCTQIKKLGAYFASIGLATKMLLGDTGNAQGIKFIDVAVADPNAMKYVTAISFHSWNGGNDQLLARWGEVARNLNIPLLVAEAGTDPQAYSNPTLLQSAPYSLNEINLYIRICALCQPESIIQWQLTADYSLLAGNTARRVGGGDENQPLKPTQRFWNLKQLGSTPAGSFYLPTTCDGSAVNCAAFGDIANGIYTVHLVNNGAERPTTLSGLPANLKELQIYVTDGQRGMKESNRIPITNGTAKFTLNTASYTTLIGSL